MPAGAAKIDDWLLNTAVLHSSVWMACCVNGPMAMEKIITRQPI